MLVYVKHRALPPLNYFLRALAAPGLRYFPDYISRKNRRPKKAVFLLPKTSYTLFMDQSIKNIGEIGEAIAAGYLKKNGYEILETNFQNTQGYRVGELDIVAREKKSNEIVFAEVKTRHKGGRDSANPELAITRAKYQKLFRIIGRYLRQKKLEDAPHRLDAIAVELDTDSRKAKLKHLKYIYY
jgi:putative endonuclease